MAFLEAGAQFDGFWVDHYLIDEHTGLDFVERVKNNKLWKRIPIFVVTNVEDYKVEEAYERLKVERIFKKFEFRLKDIISDLHMFYAGRDDSIS